MFYIQSPRLVCIKSINFDMYQNALWTKLSIQQRSTIYDNLHVISVNKKKFKIIVKTKKNAKSYVRQIFFILRKENNPSKRSFQLLPKELSERKTIL